MEAISSLQTGQGIAIGQVGSSGQTTTDSSSATGGASKTPTTKDVQKTEDKKDVEQLKKQLTDVTNALNKEMSSLNFNVKFGFNDKINEMYVSVMEKDTNKVIRKIPSDDAMKLMDKMREIVGMIFDKKA
jgi:flagellar protein FlaG